MKNGRSKNGRSTLLRLVQDVSAWGATALKGITDKDQTIAQLRHEVAPLCGIKGH